MLVSNEPEEKKTSPVDIWGGGTPVAAKCALDHQQLSMLKAELRHLVPSSLNLSLYYQQQYEVVCSNFQRGFLVDLRSSSSSLLLSFSS
jgi:hypothetical protein